jgi:hypothetical protein
MGGAPPGQPGQRMGGPGWGENPGDPWACDLVLIRLRPTKTPLVLIKIIRPVRWVAGSTLAAFGGSPRQ